MEDVAEQPLVLVTGATGYLGAWTCVKLAETGKYRVRGTTRNPSSKRATKLREVCPGIELVSCELLKDDGWGEAMDGVDFLLHTASPFNIDPTGKVNFKIPAVEGTKRALDYATKAGVKKVVLTSSNAAVSWRDDPHRGEAKEYTADDWNPVGEDDIRYEASKVHAERAAWKWAEENPNIPLITVCPGIIVGKSKLGVAGGTLDLWKMMMDAGMAPPVKLPVNNVQDVAEIHVNAIERDDVNGKRVLACEAIWAAEMFEQCAETFNPMGYKFPSSQMNGCIICCLFNCCCCVNPLSAFGAMMSIDYTTNNQLAQSMTNGGKMRDWRVTTVEMTYDFIESGALPKKNGYVSPSNKEREEVPTKS